VRQAAVHQVTSCVCCFIGQDHERAGACEHHVPESKANKLYDLKTDKSWG